MGRLVELDKQKKKEEPGKSSTGRLVTIGDTSKIGAFSRAKLSPAEKKNAPILGTSATKTTPALKSKTTNTDAWTRATPAQTKIPEKKSNTIVQAGLTSAEEPKTETIRKFGNSSWAFEYEADPDKVKAVEDGAKVKTPSVGERLSGMLKSAGLREASNLSETAGVTMDKTGGTAVTSLYQEQLDAIDRQIAAAQNQLRQPGLTDADRSDLQWAIRTAQDQRKIYEDAVRANKGTGTALHGVSDEALTASEKQDQKTSEGLGAFGKSMVGLGTGLMQAGMEGAADVAAPGLGTLIRGASAAGAASGNYRRSTDNYDAGKAQTAGALAGAGVLAGSALSGAVGSASIGVLKALGKQNDILPNILASGAAGAGYAAGETGMGEISKAVTYDDYEPNWSEIGTNLATGFAFSAINSTIGLARTSKANQDYARQLNNELQKRYELMETIFRQGTPEQKAQGAASVMDGVYQLRKTVNGLHLVGAKDEVKAINRFLDSIGAEMAFYLPDGTAASNAGALPGGTALTVSGSRSLVPQSSGSGAAFTAKSETNSVVPPVDTVRPGSYNKGNESISPAAAPEVRQMETQAEASQTANPGSNVLNAATTLFVERQGMSMPKAQEKAAIVQKLVSGEEVGPREINKLNPTSKVSQEIFTQLTGVQFPEGQLPTEQLFELYRSAHDMAVQAEVQNVIQTPVTPEATIAQTPQAQEVPGQVPQQADLPGYGGTEDIAVDSAEGRELFPGLNRLFDGDQTLTQQMAQSGFQANPETQERIAQAQAELNDAVNGTQTVAARKSGSTRSEIKLPGGETLTREDFKAVARETYGQASDSQLDAMFNGLLARTDRGETIPGLEDVARAAREMKAPAAMSLEENGNGGKQEVRAHEGGSGSIRTGDGGAGREAEGRLTGRDVLHGARLHGESHQREGQRTGSLAQGASRAEEGRTEQRLKEDKNGGETEGARVLHEGLRREPDSRTGEPDRTVREGARGNETPDRSGRGRGETGSEGRRTLQETDSQQSILKLQYQKRYVEQLRAQNPRTRDLKLPGMRTLKILPDKYLTNGMKKFKARIERMGVQMQYCLGSIQLENGYTADGVFDPNTQTIIVRADTATMPVGQAQGHEQFHLYCYLDNSLQRRVLGSVIHAAGLDNQGPDVLDNLIASQYRKGYGSYYAGFDDTSKGSFYEEFLADLNGGVSSRFLLNHKDDARAQNLFTTMRDAAQAEVRAWEKEWDAAHPTTKPNMTPSSTSQNSTEKPSFSLAEGEDLQDLADPADLAKGPQEFDSWNAAYLYFENTPGMNLAFADPPGTSPNIEVGLLDDNGNWAETVGVYSNTPEDLAWFNKDLPKYMAQAQNASEEDLSRLFPPKDGDAYDVYEPDEADYDDADIPSDSFLQGLYAKAQQSAAEAVQTNREGFTSTNTRSFKKWFHDPSGEFTNPDGKPKVFLRGSVGMGATTAHDADTAYSQGIFFTTDPSIAAKYAEGVSTGKSSTLMDAIKGRDNEQIRELKHKYLRTWGAAKDYVQENFQARDAGLRLVGLTSDGAETDKLAETDHFAIQTNAATETQLRTEGWFADNNWRELATFPKTKAGLEELNHRLGSLVRENNLGIRGYGKYYLTSENPLVVDAEGDNYHGISNDHLPDVVQGQYGDIHVDRLVNKAFQNGYDAVIVKNMDDEGGIQTQYVVKNSNQVKSVYNRSTWDKGDRDFLFSMAEDDGHRQKLENFFHGLENEYGEGSAEAMFETFEQLDRARKRAEERAADAEAAQQAAEWATDAAVEAAKMAEQAKAEKRLQKQRDAYQEQARQKAAKARLEKANAVKSARLAEQMNAGRQWSERLRKQDERASAKMESMKQAAQERLDQLRASKDQKIEDTRTAERMNAGRQAATAKRKAEAALAEEKAKRIQDHKLASKDAKTAASVLRKYHNTDTSKLTNDPVSTLRDAYHKPTLSDAAKAAADKLRTAHREFYKAFINGTQAIDDFSKYQKVDANTSVLLRTAMSCNSTTQSILQDHLVGKDGSVIDDRSLEDVVICWDGSGKHRKYNDDKQRILQDYMLHRHNIDRMSFRDKAQAAVESYEQSYPWLTTLEPREFAELVADDNRIAQRYQELIEDFQRAKNKPIFQDANGSPLTADYSRSMVQQYEQQYDWVKEKAEGVYDWWDKFMKEWVVGETISPEEYATLRETYPSYVPTYRKDKAGLGTGVSAFGGTVTAKKTIRAATGGTSPVANIEDSFVNLVEKNVKSQRTNMVLRSITDTAMTDEDGDFNGFVIFDWNDAPETLRWGLASEGMEGALEAGTDKAAANALSRDGGVCKIRAWANGERVSAYVDPELYDALEFVFNQKSGWFTKVGQKLTSPMKTFITGINPGFALRNTIRDNLTAQMNSISVVNSISGAAFEKYYARAWKEMVSNSENWQHFVDLGGTNAGYYNNEGGTYINKLRQQRMEDLNPLNMAGKALGFVGEHTESVTRFAEYLATIDRMPGGDTYGNRLVGIKNAAEVTVDFSRKGTLGKAFNAWIPYWNPAVQGIDKVVRSFFDEKSVAGKAKVLSRAALTTLPLDLILFAVYKYLGRDEEWEELSDRTKDTYYCIPLPNEHKFLKIPKSRDWGQIVGAPLMRMLQGLDGREDPFDNYFEVAISPNFLWPNPLDAIGLSTAYDLAKNEDFAGRSIVPSNYASMAKGDQWDADTSKFSKAVSDVVNSLSQKFVAEDRLSPMQLDYIISDYFGDFGDMFIRLNSIGGTDKSLPAKEQAKQIAEDLYGNWVADNRYSSASVSDYYDLLDRISQDLAAERVQNPNGYKDTPMYKLNAALNDKDNGPSTKIADLNAKVRELPDGEEKDNLKGQIVEIAREALQMYDAVQSGELQEPKLEMQYSKYGEKVSQELIALKDYTENYSFRPSNYKPKSYTDPSDKKKEYVLDEAAQEKYRELYDEEYQSVMEAAMKSSKYKSASPEKRAELLEAARDDVAPQVKDEFLKWLKKNYKATPKK